MIFYYIEIKLEPQEFNHIPYYFWCIIKKTELCSSNAGHGWSRSVELASEDALSYYNEFLLPAAGP